MIIRQHGESAQHRRRIEVAIEADGGDACKPQIIDRTFERSFPYSLPPHFFGDDEFADETVRSITSRHTDARRFRVVLDDKTRARIVGEKRLENFNRFAGPSFRVRTRESKTDVGGRHLSDSHDPSLTNNPSTVTSPGNRLTIERLASTLFWNIT